MNFKKTSVSMLLFIAMYSGLFSQESRLAKADEKFNTYAYVDARKIYLDVVESGYVSAEIYKKLGDSYYFNGELEESAKWYEQLVSDYEEGLEPEYLFRYSQSLKSVKRYDESDRIMEKFNSISGNDQRAEFFMNTRDYLKFIDMQSGKHRLLKLGMNSKFSDHAPSFNHQGELVFASSREGNNMTKAVHEWDEMPFLDLFSSGIIEKNGILKTPKRLKGKINTKFHESSTSFSKDGKTVYFTRNNYTGRKLGSNASGTILLKLYKGTFENDKWNNIEELSFNSNEYSMAHPALSADGKKLYFASDMPGSKGLSDLYVIDIHDDGTFGEAKNLGDKINTEGRETFPYISDSGNLYFSSDGHIGLGGLDVFIAVPDNDTFSAPYNVGRPVNGPDDDFSFVINEKTRIGYFASNRSGGKGNDDIYSFRQTDELITSCTQYVSGTVKDAVSKKVIVEAEVVLFDTNNQELQRTTTNDKGGYKFELECEQSYIVRATMKEYKPSEEILFTTGILEHEHQRSFELEKGGLDGKQILEGDDLAKLLDLEIIYFDLDKSFIRPDAEIELQKIISALNQYSQLKIEVRSHTDSRGDDSYNLSLSDRRAKSTVKYIVEKGNLDASRVTGKGYGETELINKCDNQAQCTEREHQLNRRSEFIIIN